MPDLDAHPGCNFLPWIGSSYAEDGLDGLQVLLVGKSHYTDVREAAPTTTQTVVRRYGVEGKSQPFVTRAMKTVDPESNKTSDSRRRFWESVAFYQFIQESVGDNPSAQPTDRMWNEAKEPFLAVVDELHPHAIVVFGREVWRHLPDGEDTLVRTLDGTETLTMKVYQTKSDHPALAGHVAHPRYPESYDVTRPRVATLLATAREEFTGA